jgi:paired amphipathic helix protein Sin3a
MHEVYAQVSELFASAPDLLEEFQHFLPEMVGMQPHSQQQQQQQQQQRGVSGGSAGGSDAPRQRAGKAGKEPQWGSKGAQAKAAKRANAEKAGGARLPKKARLGDGMMQQQQQYSQQQQQFQGQPQQPQQHGVHTPQPPAVVYSNTPSIHTSYTPLEEFEFFDHARKLIGSKAVYQEFLKLLNLFSQDIIDTRALVERANVFLGKSPELMAWFRKFVNYEDTLQRDGLPTSDAPLLDYNSLRKYGVSYRKLPKNVFFSFVVL